jgi:hypothetical protein
LRCGVALQRLYPEPFRSRGHEDQREDIRPVPSIREQRFVPANMLGVFLGAFLGALALLRARSVADAEPNQMTSVASEAWQGALRFLA